MTDAKHYLILGAYGGIGSALARRIANSGARLTLAGRDAAKLATLAQEIGGALTLPLDAASFDEVDQAFETAKAQQGELAGVANCCGSVLLKAAHLTSFAEFESVWQRNVTTAFATVRAAAKSMRGNRTGGAVVLFSSAAAAIGLANHEAIAAAKGAVEGLTLSAAATYAAQGIRVNAIAPGLVETPLTAGLRSNDLAAKGSLAMHPLGRFGSADELAAAAAWLLSDDASWITGQVLGVDGGLARLKTRGKAG